MIRSIYRSSKGDTQFNLTPEQVREALTDEKGDLWVDATHVPATREQIRSYLLDLFGFHPLSVDDALTQTHVPRMDNWDNYLYVVLHAIHLELNRTLETHELDVFIGKNYLVTIHEEPIQSLDYVWSQCKQGVERKLVAGPDHLFYGLVDAVVADYMPVVDGLDDEIDELEDEIFQEARPGTISRIFRLRRTVIRLRRILGYLREVLNRLVRDDNPVIDAAERIYFRDVYDHLVRLYDIVEGLRDMAGGALDSYVSVTSNRLNEIMRTLTVFTVLFMPLTFITGFFGMNFFADAFNVDNPLSPGLLFWLCMLSVLATPPLMLWWMSQKGWLKSLRDGSELHEPRQDSDE